MTVQYLTKSPGELLERMDASMREELEQTYLERLASGWAEARREQDEEHARHICAVREEMGERLAAYRRGTWYDVGIVVTSGVAGFFAGWHAQRTVDLRIGGVPAVALAGAPGIALGLAVDEGIAVRAAFAVGGAMFSVGAAVWAKCNPEPPTGESEEKKP